MRQLCFSQGVDTRYTIFCVFVADACLICLIWGRSSYEMPGFLWDTSVPLRYHGGDRVAGPQHLGCRTGVFLQGVFGQPLLALLAALLRVL